MFIELDGITKIIKGSVVVDSVSLRLESGHIYGLQGINGSGKTMLMRLISLPKEQFPLMARFCGKIFRFLMDWALLLRILHFLITILPLKI